MADALVTVGSYPQSLVAHAAQNLLAEHGIRAFVADEHTANLTNWALNSWAKLQVAAADAKRAMSLLAEEAEAAEEVD